MSTARWSPLRARERSGGLASSCSRCVVLVLVRHEGVLRLARPFDPTRAAGRAGAVPWSRLVRVVQAVDERVVSYAPLHERVVARWLVAGGPLTLRDRTVLQRPLAEIAGVLLHLEMLARHGLSGHGPRL